MVRSHKTQAFTLVEIMIVVLIIGLLLAIAVPNFITARVQGNLNATVANLSRINTAKIQYALQNGAPGGAAVTQANLAPAYITTWPSGPIHGAVYLPNVVGTDPTMNGLTALQLQADCGVGGSGCPF
jgi:prepilin-type N-terminal cleavage/methylation domain-containing protein